MAKKPLEIGTKDECRSCDMPIVWGPIDVESPFHKSWYHPHRRSEVEEVEVKFCSSEVQDDEFASWKRTSAKPKSYCYEMLSDYSGHCHASVVDDELFMCGIHSKREREYLAQQENRSESVGVERTIREFIDPLCDHLNGFYDLEARPEKYELNSYGHRNSGRQYSGYIVVNPAKLVDLIKQIEEEFE